MTDETDDVRVWLVDRRYNNRDLIVLSTQPPTVRRSSGESSPHRLYLNSLTAAKNVSAPDLESSEVIRYYSSQAPGH
jgi:hypothetical protein